MKVSDINLKVLLLIFTFSFTLGLGPVPWVLVGELFPAHARWLSAATVGSSHDGSSSLGTNASDEYP